MRAAQRRIPRCAPSWGSHCSLLSGAGRLQIESPMRRPTDDRDCARPRRARQHPAVERRRHQARRLRLEVRHRVVVEDDPVARRRAGSPRCSAARRAACAARNTAPPRSGLSTASASVFTSVRNIPSSHVRRQPDTPVDQLAAACADRSSRAGNRSVNAVPRPTSLSTAIVPSSCSTMRFEIARPRPRPRRLVVTKSSKIAASRSGGMPEPVSVTLISTWSPTRAGRDRHAAARLGRLNRVGDEVAVDAAEREPVAVDDQRAGRVAAPRPRRRAARLRRASTRRSRRPSR